MSSTSLTRERLLWEGIQAILNLAMLVAASQSATANAQGRWRCLVTFHSLGSRLFQKTDPPNRYSA